MKYEYSPTHSPRTFFLYPGRQGHSKLPIWLRQLVLHGQALVPVALSPSLHSSISADDFLLLCLSHEHDTLADGFALVVSSDFLESILADALVASDLKVLIIAMLSVLKFVQVYRTVFLQKEKSLQVKFPLSHSLSSIQSFTPGISLKPGTHGH